MTRQHQCEIMLFHPKDSDFSPNTNLRFRVDQTDSVLVDGDQQDLGVVGLCSLLKTKE